MENMYTDVGVQNVEGFCLWGTIQASRLKGLTPAGCSFNLTSLFFSSFSAHALDHAALAVGYGVEKGEPYWLIKNSWSKAWGDEGYIKIAMKNDNCGVLQKAVVVKIRED